MPYALVNGINLYYEISGSGPAVVLIGGLGADGHFWYKQVPELEKRFTIITPDNRDAGRSDKPDEPYTLRTMADDVRGLLDHLQIAKAHVVGASMGGFIAQEFALAYPERVAKLVLCCASFGGPNSEPIPRETLQVLLNRTGDPERDLREFLLLQFGTDYPQTYAEEVEAYVAWRIEHPQRLEAYHRQLTAATAHDTESRLVELQAPVLILHGARDRVVPPRNADLLAAKIPRARLYIFQDAGHLLLWEKAPEANRLIMEFLAEG